MIAEGRQQLLHEGCYRIPLRMVSYYYLVLAPTILTVPLTMYSFVDSTHVDSPNARTLQL
jgi:hypothetical protein